VFKQNLRCLIDNVKYFGEEGYIPCDINEVPEGGIVNIEEFENVVFYPINPNPTGNTLTINFDVIKTEDDIRFSIIDILGNNHPISFILNNSYSSGNYEHSIDISHLPAAAYYFIITTTTKQYINSFIIIR